MNITSLQLAASDRPQQEVIDQVIAALPQTRGSDMVMLPELWPCGYFSFDRYASAAQSIDGPLVTALREQARHHKLHLHTGSFIERDGSDLYNTSLLINPAGEILARYRKIHLFGYQSREQQLLTAGSDIAVADTPWGKAGMSTCYDLRFPELYRKMTDRGAVMFLVTAAWPAARTDVWELFCRARAHENLAWLFSCNLAGENAGTKVGGRSLFISPAGDVVADGGTEPGIVKYDADISIATTLRREFPALADRVFKD